MASQHPRGSLNPKFPADYIAARNDTRARPYATNTDLSASQHTSVHSHMRPASLHASSMNLNSGDAGYRRESRATAEDNTQPRFELFLLGDGEKKVTEEADTRKFSYMSSSKTGKACCFCMNPSISRRSPTCACEPSLYVLLCCARRSFPLLIYDASSNQVSPHHQSSPSTKKITLLVIFSAHDFYNRHTSDSPGTKCLIHLSGKFVSTQSFQVCHFLLTLFASQVNSSSAFRLMAPSALAPL